MTSFQNRIFVLITFFYLKKKVAYGKLVKPERPRNFQIQTNTGIVRRQILPIMIKTGDSVVWKSLNNDTDALEDAMFH